MAEDRRFDDAIVVASVDAEYARVWGTPCANCGKRLSVRKQSLLTDPRTGKHYDLLETSCVQCATPREFLFDISSFFGKHRDEPPPLTAHAPDAPQELECIVSQALRKNREERYQTAAELLADLRRLQESSRTALTPPARFASRRWQAVQATAS